MSRPATTAEQLSKATIQMIPLKAIAESPSNPRKNFGDLEGLAESLRKQGVLQPVLVRPTSDLMNIEAKYELVYGHRRLRAAKLAGLVAIPANVREMSDLEVLETQVVENGQREDIHPLEEADGYRQLHVDHKKTVEEIAARVGKSVAYVYGRLKLAELEDEKARQAFLAGEISASVALLIARLSPDDQAKASKQIIEEHDKWLPKNERQPMPYREAAKWVRENFMLALKSAPFDVDDADLVKEAGPCTTCPKRTGNAPSLFPDVDSADVCTDPACFKSKREASLIQLKAKAAEKGQEVLPDSKAKGIFSKWDSGLNYGSPFAKASDVCDDDPKKRTWKDLLGKDAEIVLARNPKTGSTWQLVHKLDSLKKLKEKGVEFAKKAVAAASRGSSSTRPHVPSEEQQARDQERREIEREITRETIAAIGAAVAKDTTGRKGLLWLAQALIDHSYKPDLDEVLPRYGLEKGKHDLSKLTIGNLVAMLVEIELNEDTWHLTHHAKQLGVTVDVKKVTAEVTARRAAAKKAGEAQAPAQVKKAKGKK